MKSRKKLLPILIACFLIFGGIMLFTLYPLSFDGYQGLDFQVLFIQDNIQIDNFSALPNDNIDIYTIHSTDIRYQSLTSYLEQAKYTCCFHTINCHYFPEGYGEDVICIIWPNTSVYLSKSSSHLVVNGVVYHQASSFNLYDMFREVINETAASCKT